MDQRATTADIAGRTVLVRASLSEGNHLAALGGLLRELGEAGARSVVLSSLGRPSGEYDPTLSFLSRAAPLSRASGRTVHFIPHSVGAAAEARVAAVPFGEIALVENLAFHKGEAAGDRTFAMRLSVLGDFYLDATGGRGARKGASLAVLPEFLPCLLRAAPFDPSTGKD